MHGTIQLAAPQTLRNRRGRKRKQGKRLLSGHLTEVDRSPDDRRLTAMQPHRRHLQEVVDVDGVIHDFSLHEKSADSLGLLHLTGRIDDQHHEAGRLYAVRVGAYLAMRRAPRGTSGSGRGYACPPEGCGEASEDCRCQEVRNRYCGAYEALAEAGRPSVMLVNAVAVHGTGITSEGLPLLKMGLTALARYFGLTGHRKSGNRRN